MISLSSRPRARIARGFLFEKRTRMTSTGFGAFAEGEVGRR
jgi:hypothetical protein